MTEKLHNDILFYSWYHEITCLLASVLYILINFHHFVIPLFCLFFLSAMFENFAYQTYIILFLDHDYALCKSHVYYYNTEVALIFHQFQINHVESEKKILLIPA